MTQSKENQIKINNHFQDLLGTTKEFEQVKTGIDTYSLKVGTRLYVVNYADWGFGLNLKSCGDSLLKDDIANMFCGEVYVYEWGNKIDVNHLETILLDIDENANFDCLSDDIDDDVERFEKLIRTMDEFNEGKRPFDEKFMNLVTKVYGRGC